VSEDESQLSDLFLGVATALYETQRAVKALRFFEPLRNIPDYLDATALYNTGMCYLETGDKRQAEQCFTAALDFEEQTMDTRINARYELAKMYEAARQNAEAYILVNEALNLEKDRDGSSTESNGGAGMADNGRDKSQPKRKKAQREPIVRPAARKPREKKAGVVTRKPREPGVARRTRPLVFALDEDRRIEEERRSKDLAEKWRIIREERDNSNQGPGDTWLSAAKDLVDDFRSFKAFYPWDRYLTHLGLMEDEASPSSMNPLLLKMAQRLRDGKHTILSSLSILIYADCLQRQMHSNRQVYEGFTKLP
jgi:general transcription factor 3C polypeptide 3 (transcription factor C subunit 4)